MGSNTSKHPFDCPETKSYPFLVSPGSNVDTDEAEHQRKDETCAGDYRMEVVKTGTFQLPQEKSSVKSDTESNQARQ